MPQDNPRSESARNGTSRNDHGRAERPRGERTFSATDNMAFGDVGASNVAAGLRLQREMLGLLSDMGQDWLARASADAQLALRLPNRLTAARSVPDAVAAYQEWFGEWLNRCSEESQRLLSDSQKIVVTGTRCFIGERSALPG